MADRSDETTRALAYALWQCGVLSGMDTDGDTGPEAMIAGMGDAGFAAAMVEDVRQLRADYQEALEEIEALEQLAEVADRLHETFSLRDGDHGEPSAYCCDVGVALAERRGARLE